VTDLEAVETSLEPCVSFAVDPSERSPVCTACGWLEEEHVDAARGRVAPLRRGVALPERRAS